MVYPAKVISSNGKGGYEGGGGGSGYNFTNIEK